jgi:Putative phage holin Dp-1
MDNSGFTLPVKLYDFLKWVALVVLPAVAALVLGLGVLLHWDAATVTAGVVTLVDTFLGAVLGKSSSNFKFQNTLGDLVIGSNEDGTAGAMKIIGKLENPVFKDGGQVLLNVRREQSLA